MSQTRDRLNVASLTRMLGGRSLSADLSAPIAIANAGAGGGGGERPIDWASPDESLTLYANVTDAGAIIRLQESCGAQVLLRMRPDGTAQVRVIGCDGVGYSLGPDGLKEVAVTGAGTEEEAETSPPGSQPLGAITVQACVNGVTKTLTLFGYVHA